ncbi:MAG: hemolysin III family protein [Actinobacteria bacterium]|nr:hemolysin III family protein [Actinomycetota bacterium]
MLDVLTAVRPRHRGRMHQIAFFVSIPAGAALVALATSASARVGAIVYALSLTGLFGTSAAYHRLAHGVRARAVMRRLDHAMIFVLIAGSYTPMCLLALRGSWRVAALSAVWSVAAVGVALKVFRLQAMRLGNSLYVVLGWAVLLILPQLTDRVGAATIVLLGAGGVLYTVGAVVLTRRRPDPVPHVFGYHEVWHSLVVAAAACHYVMILRVVQAA